MSIITTTELVNQVRDQTDEFSTVNVTDSDILQALNRAQSEAVNVLARHYADPYIAQSTLTLSAGTSEYDLPEGMFEDRLESLEVNDGSLTYPIERITFRDIHQFERSGSATYPQAYAIVGRKVRIYPTPDGTYNARLWYFRSPDSLVASQGRIEYVDTVNNQIHVDSIGSALTATTNDLGSYVNVINKDTGEVRATLQIKTISGNEITFKSVQSGRRSSVHNRTITYSVTSAMEVDDYLCLSAGTCVPFFGEGIANFLVQFAVAELRRRLEDNPDLEQRVLDAFSRRVERQWAGRERQQRVARRSSKWRQRRLNAYPRGRSL